MKKKINITKTFIVLLLGSFQMTFTNPIGDSKGKVKLVFLHERAFWGDEVEIKINNKKIVDLGSNKYIEIEIDADNLDIIINRCGEINKKSKPDIQATLTAESDKVYYLKIYREIDYFTNKLYLVRVSEQTAKKVMKSMKSEKIPLNNE